MRLLLLLCCTRVLSADLVEIRQTAWISAPHASAEIAWQNSWRNERNHDAVWIFFKVRGKDGYWRHAAIKQASANSANQVLIPPDRAGVFCQPGKQHRGPSACRVEVTLEPPQQNSKDTALDLKAFAIEMVYIPEGAFWIGDNDARGDGFGVLYRSDAQGRPGGLYNVRSEAAIDIGPREDALYYHVNQPEYQGDRKGPIPGAFPKGTSPFYAMKYEITQGEYASFLNSLPATHTPMRAIHGGKGYYEARGSIRLHESGYVADKPGRPANWISWDDGAAFADWAGLRPMTELEFTKAARGTAVPKAGEYPWGTADRSLLKRVVLPNDDLASVDESTLTDETRAVHGASFYWVMDLAGSVWERVVSIGHPVGRGFTGTHGDGRLDTGFATNQDWPRGDYGFGGFGYRGGGHYEHSMPPNEFLPQSPVEFRRFGAWGTAPRSIAYGFRCVRTAPRQARLIE